MIELNSLVKKFTLGDETITAVNNANLNVDSGEFISIIGPSGSGKSTLMTILGLLDRADSGTYLFDGMDVTQLSDNEQATIRNEKIGFVFQNFNLLPRLSALVNVALPLVYAGVPEEERLKRARDTLTAVGLGERVDHRPNEMSGGQRQRVAIARALINNPAIIMADEPTGNLDSKSSYEIMDIFRQLNDAGKTIVMVTHEPDIAERTKRIIHMVDGKIVKDEWR